MIYSVIDVETTGGSPKNSKITEIAIYRHDGENVIDEFVSLINPEMKIPTFVSNLTGITDEMVEDAPKFYEVAKQIIEFTEGTIFVAHNVSFDYGMIRSEFKSLGFDYRLPHLCTVRSSRHILPGKESYSLGKLTRSLGIELKGRHRAGGDAMATAHLLTMLLENNDNQLDSFIQQELNPQVLNPKLNLDVIEEIPNRAGLYRFYNEMNELIYLGKSKAVRTQIELHLKNTVVKKSAAWGQEITRIECELTGSELIAAILEHQILKKGMPKYNRAKRKSTKSNSLFPDQMNEMAFNGESFYVLGKGRMKHEKSLILVENGSFVGYGFAPFHLHRLEPIYWKRYITLSTEDDEIQEMIFNFIKKNKLDKVMI